MVKETGECKLNLTCKGSSETLSEFSIVVFNCLVFCSFQSPKLLHKYVASYAANLVKGDKVVEALGLYVQHGAPALSSVRSL